MSIWLWGRAAIDLQPVLQIIQKRDITAALEQKTEKAILESLEMLSKLKKESLKAPKEMTQR